MRSADGSRWISFARYLWRGRCVAGRMLLAGYKIAYAAEARVYHSHAYSLVQEF
jgi:hypothetical protein